MTAAAQWAAWWRRLLKFAVDEVRLRKAEASSSDVMARLEGMSGRYNKIIDPPDFESLEGMPALRMVVVATFDQGAEWFNRAQPKAGPGAGPGLFAREEVQSAAQSAAAERGVAIGDMNAVMHVLNVEGS